MWPGATPAWLAALAQSHTVYARAEVWFDGQFVSAVDIQDGSVSVTARNRVRRTATFTVAEDLWPAEATDLLAPYGAEIRAYRGMLDVTGNQIGGRPAPVFCGRVESVSRQRNSGVMTVSCQDLFAGVNDFQFEAPRAPATAAPIVGTIGALVMEAVGTLEVVDLTGPGSGIPAGIMWQSDRGQAIDDLATSIGAESYITPDGLALIVRPVPTLAGAPVWTLRSDSEDAVIISDQTGRARTDVANKVVVDVERSGDTPLLVAVADTNPLSPTRFGGPYGKVVRHMSNALITTAAQAAVAGEARLARVIGITRTREIECPPNPGLEAGDVIRIETSEGTEIHIADSFTLPLNAEATMRIQTRSVTSTTV